MAEKLPPRGKPIGSWREPREETRSWQEIIEVARLEANRLTEALTVRANRRQRHAEDIQAKLPNASPRHQAKLQRELDRLETYEDRHPNLKEAVDMHLEILYGVVRLGPDAYVGTSRLEDQLTLGRR